MDIHDIALAAGIVKGGGGSGGTTDYTDLNNKPQVNSVQLVGNKSTADLGIVEPWVGTAVEYAQQSANIPAGTPYIITDDQDIDTVPTQGSTNPITSGGVYNSLARLDPLTGDVYFGQTRVARVMDSDSYEALTTKEDIFYLTYPTPAVNASLNTQRIESPTTEEVEDEMRTEPEEEPIEEPPPDDDMR